jgi:hypothetical protein
LALQSGNPKALNVVMAKMLGTEEFCTQEPHFEGEKVFGSQKRKVDIPLGSEYESYRPTKLISSVYESGQGPLELEVLVAA